jgi:hypothetical protein
LHLCSANTVFTGANITASASAGQSLPLACYFVNACSIVKANALQQLHADFISYSIDVGAVVETHLTKRHDSHFSTLEGYRTYRTDREGRKGGGVCIFVSDVFNSELIITSNTNEGFKKRHEISWVRIEKNACTYLVCAVYHPPKPVYDSNEFLTRLQSDIDELLLEFPDCILYIVGDFNQLQLTELLSDTGLTQLVTKPTRGTHTLDLFVTNMPDLLKCSVIKSTVTTDHLACLITGKSQIISDSSTTMKPRRRVRFFDTREQYVIALAKGLHEYNWNSVLLDDNVNSAYESFLKILWWHINKFIPLKTVTICDGCPEHITPVIKSLLRKRNRLRRHGKVEDADSLTVKIGKMIAENRSASLVRVESRDTKKLWSAVKPTLGCKFKSTFNDCLFDNLDSVNKHFADVATDTQYSLAEIYKLTDSVLSEDCADIRLFNEYDIFTCLSTVKRTAAGYDNVPFWVFKNCAIELTPVVTHLYNLILTTSTPPSNWLKALVTPVPKKDKSRDYKDLRPISVTPILSRLFERLIVRSYVLPLLHKEQIGDQFAYRPTGSTTAALVYITHHISRLLETNCYVRCLCIDFSKAFDTVKHNVLFKKLSKLNLPAAVLRWIMNFLTGRSQAVVSGGKVSHWLPITCSIVQGSGIGPTLYIAYAADLKPISGNNMLCKYADDTNLLVPENTDVSIDKEFANLVDWANVNGLKINVNKTKEMVFHRPNFRQDLFPGSVCDIEQVESFKMLGVWLTPTLSTALHVNNLLAIANQRLYLLLLLKRQGLSPSALDIIFQVVVLSKFLYALPAFAGYLTAADIARFNAFFRKAERWGIVNACDNDFDLIRTRAESKLFNQITCNSGHCLNCLLPNERTTAYTLRQRGHCYEPPMVKTELFKKSFIIRSLYFNL